MSAVTSSTLTAVLGPTNTGKTHLAIERMCGHASGMMGFPLRLLAREVYDRVVGLKGAAQVALITGEEKILPPNTRYFICTAESMPQDREVAFVALDEAQLGADTERGHVFTDRLLHRRGYAETMILGSAMLAPLIRRLLPKAEIVGRPRFSTLAHAEPKKLSRLPKRSAVIAFSADEVYALAEMLRRHKGGAAVVMGALSPRTRNAQVALYQSGEVDYLVATDAIGMGLNLDIGHVAFASLSKFDGRRRRRLSIPEMAQIAGRAGRHQRDGTFGHVQLGEEGAHAFEAAEVDAIENHIFPPLQNLVWRNAALNYASLGGLIASLDARPTVEGLTRAEDAIDFAVLKRLGAEDWVKDRARSPAMLQRLWAACGLPDFRKTGVDEHTRLVGRVFRHLSEGAGHLPTDWIAAEVARIENVAGDIGQLSDRIAAARTWTYIAHRSDWLADPEHWAKRTRSVEDRLSDALHKGLTQRFVDRRTAVLLRDLKARAGDLTIRVDDDGAVLVEGESIGVLQGFRFIPDPSAKAGETRLLLAAAERRLGAEIARRAKAAAADSDAAFTLEFSGRVPPRVFWRGAKIAKLGPGRDPLRPKLLLDRGLEGAAPELRAAVAERIERWIAAENARLLGPLVELAQLAGDGRAPAGVSPAARGLVHQLVAGLGCIPRERVAPLTAALSKPDRAKLSAAGVRVGATHIFAPALLRPAPTRLRLALWAAHRETGDCPAPPPPGRVALEIDPAAPPGFYEVAGYWPIGPQAVRVDMVERLARAMHGAREGQAAFAPDDRWVQSVGASREGFSRLMRALGYREQALAEGKPGFAWRGQGVPRQAPPPPRPNRHSPFNVLREGRLPA
ncbi:MAG: helicase-related protein [Sphingomonadaceae bacterium]|nr:helicase-related protein [Sphingomonadaceae bacterium]